MKLIDSSYEIIEPKSYDLGSVFKHIELCGRVCYKSEDKITPDSSTKFVDRMIKSGHGAMLEHGTVYLRIPTGMMAEVDHPYCKYLFNPYSKVTCKYVPLDGYIYMTTNYRVLVENGWLDDLKYICEPTECHEKRITVRFVCDRGVSHEFVRHRHFSFSQESQRYCGYNKNKFGNEITFIKPYCIFGNVDEIDRDNIVFDMFLNQLELAEEAYMCLLEDGCIPQEARAVLPNATKTELIMTGFASDWQHFFELRDDNRAHPDAQKLAKPLHEEFIKRGYIYGKNKD